MYYIYHIPGVKIGCTKIGKRRITVQGYDNYEILESYDDITIAAEREKELQIQYGYKVDKIKYDEAKYSEMGKVAGDKAVQTGHIKKIQKIGTKIAASKPRTKSQLESFKKTREIGARIAWSKPRTDLQLESMKIAQQLHFNSPNFIKSCSKGGRIRAKQIAVSITAYDKITKELVGIYNSISECARELGLNQADITHCLNPNKSQYSTKGFIFTKN